MFFGQRALFYAFISVVTFSIYGCCTKKDCDEVMQLTGFQLYNYTSEQADTIYVYSYEKDSHFSVPLDSHLTKGTNTGSGEYLYGTFNSFTIQKDYKIRIAGTGDEFTLGNFKTEKFKCNRCFLIGSKSNYNERIASFEVNGKKVDGSTVKLNE